MTGQNFGPGSRNLKEVVTYWAQGATRDDFNMLSWAAPVTLKGFWVENFQDIVGKDGQQIVSKAHVDLSAPVAVNGMLARGDQTAYANPRDPAIQPVAQEIQAYQSTPDLRYMDQRYKAYL